MNTYLFDDFAKDLLQIRSFRCFVDQSLVDPDYNTDNPEGVLKEWMEGEDTDPDDFLRNPMPFVLAYKAGREALLAYLERYYDVALEWYEYWEYRHSGFGSGYRCFHVFNSYVLALCSRYYASINETEKAKIACFLFLCRLSYMGDLSEEDYEEGDTPGDLGYYWEVYDLVGLYDAFESFFQSIKEMIGPDWQAVHPSITWNIGRYYLSKNNYRKAREFFSLGASIDYDGRQSIDPFIAVGENQYELGMIYLKGLGVKANPKKALEYFEMAAESAGEPTIPVIQDMRDDGLLPAQVDYVMDVLTGYGDINVYNRDKYVYYKELNEIQTEKLEICADVCLARLPDYDTLSFLRDIYRYRLHDYEKVREVEGRMERLAESAPVEKRSGNMDAVFVSRWKENWKNTVVKPSMNSGSIPKEPKPGDTFFCGTLANEPMEWKVLEINDDGTFFAVTAKVILKMCYNGLIEWLNTDFIENVFTNDEKEHIVAHDYKDLRRSAPTYIYLPERSQLEVLEDLSQPFAETTLAKSMSRDKSIYDIKGISIEPGRFSNIDRNAVRGIRPAMDLYIEAPAKNTVTGH